MDSVRYCDTETQSDASTSLLIPGQSFSPVRACSPAVQEKVGAQGGGGGVRARAEPCGSEISLVAAAVAVVIGSVDTFGVASEMT